MDLQNGLFIVIGLSGGCASHAHAKTVSGPAISRPASMQDSESAQHLPVVDYIRLTPISEAISWASLKVRRLSYTAFFSARLST